MSASDREDVDLMGGQGSSGEDVDQYFVQELTGHADGESSTRRGRGETQLLSLSKKGFPPVKFDDAGRAIGEYAGKFNKWLGILAKTKFDFTVENWKQFKKEDKMAIWETIKVRQ